MLHVLLDLYGCKPELLEDEAFLRQVLETYPARIGMQRILTELAYIETSDPLDDGYSGFSIIASSHISLHAWRPYGMVNLDIFSCEEFAVPDAVAYAVDLFGAHTYEVQTITRALGSPRSGKRGATVAVTDSVP